MQGLKNKISRESVLVLHSKIERERERDIFEIRALSTATKFVEVSFGTLREYDEPSSHACHHCTGQYRLHTKLKWVG